MASQLSETWLADVDFVIVKLRFHNEALFALKLVCSFHVSKQMFMHQAHGTDRFPETSERNYHYSLCNSPEEGTSHSTKFLHCQQ